MSQKNKLYDFEPNWATHPGERVAEFMNYYNWTQTELAERTGLSINTINRIIQAKPREDNKDRITSQVAERLARVFGMKSSYFVNLQALYDESLPRRIKIEELEKEKEILKKIPYSEMANLGWVPKTLKVDEKLKNLYSFLGLALFELLKKTSVGATAFRKKETEGFSPETLAIWLRKGELECLNLDIPEFNKNKLKSSLKEIRSLTLKPFSDIKEELKSILLECGVVLSYTPKLKNSCVNGATRWYKNSVLIQVSDSRKRDDIFWFTLFHELGHTMKHLKNKSDDFVDLDDEEKNEFEIEADAFAKDTLIPNDLYQKFIQSNFDESDMLDFAKKINISNGVLAGRLCFDGYMSQSQRAKYTVKLDF